MYCDTYHIIVKQQISKLLISLQVLTRIRREGKEVTFDERFQLTLRDNDPADHALRFIACSIDRYSQLHITGETTVSLSHVTGGYQSTLSLVLTPPPQVMHF